MLLRNVNTGGLLLYDIPNNQIAGAYFLGNVGLDWQYAGIAPVPVRAHPTSCCATSTPARSRSTTSRAIRSSDQRA
jgi:hypothetical protein